jgi:hypothetical protein
MYPLDSLEIISKLVKIQNHTRHKHKIDFIAFGLDALLNLYIKTTIEFITKIRLIIYSRKKEADFINKLISITSIYDESLGMSNDSLQFNFTNFAILYFFLEWFQFYNFTSFIIDFNFKILLLLYLISILQFCNFTSCNCKIVKLKSIVKL